MNTNVRTIVVLLLVELLICACAAQPIYNINNRQHSQYYSRATVHDLIVKALTFKRWEIDSATCNQISASIKVRQHTASILIKYDGYTYSINHQKSTNLSFDGKTIHRNYNKWIALLEKEIDYNLDFPSKAKVRRQEDDEDGPPILPVSNKVWSAHCDN